jgi:hypothetical protein
MGKPQFNCGQSRDGEKKENGTGMGRIARICLRQLARLSKRRRYPDQTRNHVKMEVTKAEKPFRVI